MLFDWICSSLISRYGTMQRNVNHAFYDDLFFFIFFHLIPVDAFVVVVLSELNEKSVKVLAWHLQG